MDYKFQIAIYFIKWNIWNLTEPKGLIKTPKMLLVDYVNDIDPSTVTK